MTLQQQQQPQQTQHNNSDPTSVLRNGDVGISAELMQMKIENESIIAECRVRPRSFEDIKDALLDQLAAFPAMAESAIYEKPVGRAAKTGEQRFVRGLSIRAAETLAEAYGFNRISSTVTPLDDACLRVKVEAVFVDFQQLRIWQDSGVLSRRYKDRSGRMAEVPEDRFLNLTAKAEASKRVREVILRSVNQGLKAWFHAQCTTCLGQVLTADRADKIVANFAAIDVTLDQIETLLDQKLSLGWTEQHRARLIGVWTAIQDRETTVAEVFANTTLSRDSAQPATLGDLTTREPESVFARAGDVADGKVHGWSVEQEAIELASGLPPSGKRYVPAVSPFRSDEAPPQKTKRKRRTKIEMEEARRKAVEIAPVKDTPLPPLSSDSEKQDVAQEERNDETMRLRTVAAARIEMAKLEAAARDTVQAEFEADVELTPDEVAHLVAQDEEGEA